MSMTMPVRFDLEHRTQKFAKEVRQFVKQLPRTTSNLEDVPQLIRSSGSVAANYIEANEALGKKDFLMRIRICLKEAKESAMWLTMIENGSEIDQIRQELFNEAKQFVYIFSSILKKTKAALEN